jgi:hypothetical protein
MPSPPSSLPRRPSAHRAAATALLLVLGLAGCATLASVMSLAQVEFDLENVGRVNLAGVDLTRVRGYDDLPVADALRVGTALARGALPLELTLNVRADNPPGNPDARLVGLDWDLFLEGRRTVGGGLADVLVLPSGQATRVPVQVRLDLLEFFDGSARDLVNLAAGLAGVGGQPVAVRLEATPTVDTPLGPIRYPRPLSMGASVGGG